MFRLVFVTLMSLCSLPISGADEVTDLNSVFVCNIPGVKTLHRALVVEDQPKGDDDEFPENGFSQSTQVICRTDTGLTINVEATLSNIVLEGGEGDELLPPGVTKRYPTFNGEEWESLSFKLSPSQVFPASVFSPTLRKKLPRGLLYFYIYSRPLKNADGMIVVTIVRQNQKLNADQRDAVISLMESIQELPPPAPVPPAPVTP